MAVNEVSKSWFCVFNNPVDHGYDGTPEEICNKLRDEWINGSNTRSGAWLYCISADGLHHIHMVLEDKKNMRFSAVKKEYCCGMHIEPTKGSKKEVEDYIHKRGKFEEKGEVVVCCVQFGDIKGAQGRRTDLVRISEMIDDGLMPQDIFSEDVNSLRYKGLVRDMFFLKKEKETPIVRDVKVYWHTGESGSGKSYSRVLLSQEVGEDDIFFLTTFGSGAFDNYCGQSVLWIEDYRGEFSFSMFLRLLDVYKCEVPARYSNVKAIWNEVHITSVLTPMQCYADKTNSIDNIKQLLRRITSVLYHYKSDLGYGFMEFSPFETWNNMFKSVQTTLKMDKEAVLFAEELKNDSESWLSSEDLVK